VRKVNVRKPRREAATVKFSPVLMTPPMAVSPPIRMTKSSLGRAALPIYYLRPLQSTGREADTYSTAGFGA